MLRQIPRFAIPSHAMMPRRVADLFAMGFPILRPVAPMLSRPATSLPIGPGYEPKYDGFRAIVHRDNQRMELDSRNGRSLARYFPELLDALADALPGRSVIDGEIVTCASDGLDFEELSSRLRPRRSDPDKSKIPAAFVAFDILADGHADLRRRRFAERRAILERVVRERPTVVITPQTADPDAAGSWLTHFNKEGIEGVVAKRAELPYDSGRRVMVKVRRQPLIDCVVGGFVPSREGLPLVLVIGVYDRCRPPPRGAELRPQC